MVKKSTNKFTSDKKKPIKFLPNIFLCLLALILIFGAKEFIEYTEEGSAILSSERAAKLAKELEELDNAEQYVLLAAKDGYYPCFACVDKSRIFLRKGNIFKYGVTRKGEQGRYGEWHVDQGLLYFIEFQGTLQECLREEKLKIYNYAIHPENLSRSIPLIRPPGNKQDN